MWVASRCIFISKSLKALLPPIFNGWFKFSFESHSHVTRYYLKERNCLRDKFFAIFEKSTGSQFAKLNPSEKKKFLSFFRISKTYIFTLGSLSINDGHVKNILQDIKQNK